MTVKTSIGIVLLAVLCLGILCSCGFLDDDRTRMSISPRSLRTKYAGGGSSSAEAADTSVYVLGIEYPGGYDWRSDPDYGKVGSLVVYRDQKRLLTVRAGAQYRISPDSDRNRIIGGHLYSDYSEGGTTTVKKDGEVLFSYDGDEVVVDVVVSGESVYTLGRNRYGEGFSFRKDGEAAFSLESGILLGNAYSDPLYEDGGELCFSYYTESKGGRKYYLYAGQGPAQIELSDQSLNVLAMRRIAGEVYYACTTRYSYGNPVIFCGDRSVACKHQPLRTTRNCRFLVSGERVCLEGDAVEYDGTLSRCLWESDGTLAAKGTGIVGFCISQEGTAYVEAGQEGWVDGFCVDGKHYSPEDSVKIYSPDCAAYRDGRFYAAFSPAGKERSPFLWRNGRNLAYLLNGYISGIYFPDNGDDGVP